MAFEKVDPTEKIVNGLIRGRSFSRIAAEMGGSWTPEQVHKIWTDYLNKNYSPSTEIEMRFLSLARLERLLDLLWNQVEGGDFATEGKQTANVIKVIERINELMGLNRDPLKEAQVELTKAQTQMVYGILVQLRVSLLNKVMRSVDTLELDDNQRETTRTQIEASWSDWFHEASTMAWEQVKEGEEVTV